MKRYLLLLAAGALAAQSVPEPTMLLGASGRGNGGPALEAILDGPWGIVVDAEGNTYVSESNAGLIRRIGWDGKVETYAGSGARADGREGSPARETDLLTPTALLIDAEDRLLFFDAGSCRIRRVEKSGVILSIAGTGRCTGTATGGGFPFPGGGFPGLTRDKLALDTELGAMGGMTFDPSGRLVFSDEQSSLVRRIDTDGIVRTIAGAGSAAFGGDLGEATSAFLNGPGGVAYDAAGNLYIADGRNCRVRKVDVDGIITTVAGRATCATRSTSFVSGGATTTALGRLQGIAYDAVTNTLLLAAAGQARVIRYDPNTLRTSNFAGNGSLGRVDAMVTNRVNEPRSIAVHPTLGVLVTAQTAFQVLRVVDGRVEVFAGRWPQLEAAESAKSLALLQPAGFCNASDGSLVLVDAGSEQVLRFRGPDEVTPVAGDLYPTGFAGGDDGPALKAWIATPRRVACGPRGEVYLAHGSQVRVIEPAGLIRNVTKNYDEPSGLALDAQGRLLIADAATHRVIRYDFTARTFTVIAGTGKAGSSGDDGAAIDALLNSPGDLVVDAKGNILVADRGNRRVRVIGTDGQIRALAGSRREFTYGDLTGELATDVGLGRIVGLAVDGQGNVVILEAERLSMMTPDGRMTVLLGYLSEDDAGVKSYRGQPLAGASGLILDREGWAYLSLQQEPRVLVVELGSRVP